MSIFGDIVNKIVGAAESVVGMGSAQAATTSDTPTEGTPTQQTQAAANPISEVDVEAALSKLAEQKGGESNWRTSIVDLLKLLDLDSSLNARKELANELNIHVAADGSAEENIALHQAVMEKLEQNGGKVPDSLKGL